MGEPKAIEIERCPVCGAALWLTIEWNGGEQHTMTIRGMDAGFLVCANGFLCNYCDHLFLDLLLEAPCPPTG